MADELGARTVAFPAISAGVYRWPMDDAARIAITTVRESGTAVDEVRFVLFGQQAYEIFTAAAGVDAPAALAASPSAGWLRTRKRHATETRGRPSAPGAEPAG